MRVVVIEYGVHNAAVKQQPFDLGTAEHPALQGGGAVDQSGIFLNSDGSLASGHEITEFNSDNSLVGLLGPENLPPRQHPLHQGPHAQLAGDGQGLVQQGDGPSPVALSIPLS